MDPAPIEIVKAQRSEAEAIDRRRRRVVVMSSRVSVTRDHT